jgi:hypothetical protein
MSLFTNQPPPTGAPFGLRQRRDTEKTDENANPNNAKTTLFDIKPKVRAPPRVFLATSTKSALRTTAAAPSTLPPSSKEHTNSSQALTLIHNPPSSDESSHWILAHGFRTEPQFQSLLRRLESCGTITSSRGSRKSLNNWIAVRYSSVLAAHKALCQNGSIVSVAGTTMVVGVQSFVGSDVEAKLGIDIYNSGDKGEEDLGLYSLVGCGVRELPVVDDSEVLLINGGEERRMIEEEDERSRLDGVCGKVLAWFFGW